MARLLDRGGEVVEQMPAIGDLLGFWNGFTDGTGVGTGPVPADDLRAGMFAQPGSEGGRVPVGQDIDHAGRFDVDQDGSVAPALAEGELVDAQHPRRTLGHHRGREQAQQMSTAGG